MTEHEMNKACEWLDNTLPNIEYITNASALRQTKKQYIDAFRKAMGAVIKENLTTELTWQDIQKIWRIGVYVADYNSYHNIQIEDEAFFKEILNRYINDSKKVSI